MTNDYGTEHKIPTPWGGKLCCPAYPEPCSYIRFIDSNGKEVAYWNVQEWTESEEQGMDVMGAIIGCFSAFDEVMVQLIAEGRI